MGRTTRITTTATANSVLTTTAVIRHILWPPALSHHTAQSILNLRAGDLIEDGACRAVAMVQRDYGALLGGAGADIARRLGDFERTQEGSAHAFGSLLGHGD